MNTLEQRQPSAAKRGGKAPKRLLLYESPVRLLVLIAATLFITHTVAMVMFALLPQFPMWTESLIESILLLLLLFPVLYFLSLRPLLMHIAEREQAEEIMRESEHKYRQLFENLSEAAFLIDAETGRILDANKQAELLLGYSRGQIMGMNQGKLYPPEKNEEARARLSSLARQNGLDNYEARLVDHVGKMLTVHVGATTLVLFGRKLVFELVRDLNARSA